MADVYMIERQMQFSKFYKLLNHLQAAPAGASEGSYIDEWYEQSKFYNNPAYAEYGDNWDTGSAHMLVSLKGGSAAGGGQEITEVSGSLVFSSLLN